VRCLRIQLEHSCWLAIAKSVIEAETISVSRQLSNDPSLRSSDCGPRYTHDVCPTWGRQRTGRFRDVAKLSSTAELAARSRPKANRPMKSAWGQQKSKFISCPAKKKWTVNHHTPPCSRYLQPDRANIQRDPFSRNNESASGFLPPISTPYKRMPQAGGRPGPL
jgi:hypothetical protein